MEEFSCCSRWQECQAEERCVQEGNSVISKEEYLRCCRLAQRYQAKYEKETQTDNPVYKTSETGQLSIFV
ncbi:MAG: hypothetical protein QMD10_07095 [Desulfitobacteriaceae bacterium]|nr:hypothetical protein [Desulfitobacteriaceae bacterium]